MGYMIDGQWYAEFDRAHEAAEAGIDLDEDSRFYSRMRAARRRDAKYVRNERIPDEFYRLDDDPGEIDDRAGDGDDAEAELESALSAFESRIGGAWGDAGTDGDVLADMGDDAQARLRDLGYLE